MPEFSPLTTNGIFIYCIRKIFSGQIGGQFQYEKPAKFIFSDRDPI